MDHASENIQWQPSLVVKADRYQMNGHKSCLLWLTGLSASGKSSLAYEVERKLHSLHILTYVLDGDNLRHGLNRDLGFSSEDRKENIRRTAEVAKLLVDAGVVTLLAMISPYQAERDTARRLFEPEQFIEVFVDCPLHICERRDPKGLYKKARDGSISNFTGISAPYERPEQPEIVITSDRQSLEDSAEQIVQFLLQRIRKENPDPHSF